MKKLLALIPLLCFALGVRAQFTPVDHGNYQPNDRTVVFFDLTVNGTQVDPDLFANSYQVAAFIGDECRAIADVQYVDLGRTIIPYLIIEVNGNYDGVASDNDKPITFKLFDRASQGTYPLTCGSEITFGSQVTYGEPSRNHVQLSVTIPDFSGETSIILNDITVTVGQSVTLTDYVTVSPASALLPEERSWSLGNFANYGSISGDVFTAGQPPKNIEYTLTIPDGMEVTGAPKTKTYTGTINICSLLTFAQFSGTVTDEQGVKYTANDDETTCKVSGHEDNYSATIVIPQTFQGRTVSTIGNNAFNGCSGLTSITIPGSVTVIGDDAFSGCYSMTSITIPGSVRRIGREAFAGCDLLTSIIIPRSVINIEYGAFSGCSHLTSIVVEPGNTVYDSRGDCNAIIITSQNRLIAGCIKTVIPNSVTSIGSYAFSGCYRLTSITIPNSVTRIESFAFSGCLDLTSITIPYSVTSIREKAFSDCSGLTSITVEEGNNFYDSRGNCNAIISTTDNQLIAGCKKTVIPNSVTSIGDFSFCGCRGLTSIIIPNSVTSIGYRAFYSCYGLTSITIPNSVTSIEGEAFWDCCGLTSITIPNSVTSIGNFTFYNCDGLTSITIPNSVTSIGDWAFYNCYSLASITIPNSVTSIGDYAFDFCDNLTSVTVESKTPVAITANVFTNRANATLYVPYGRKATYAAADYWKEFKEIIEPFTGTVTDEQGVKYAANDDETTCYVSGHEDNYSATVVIPQTFQGRNVSAIGVMTFNGCSGLTSITIPGSVTSIGSQAFSECSGLTFVTVESKTPVAITESVFTNRANATLYVPYGSKAAYDAADYWKEFKEIKAPFTGNMIDEQGVKYTANEDKATCYVSGHDDNYSATVVIPQTFQGRTVSAIGDKAFRFCSSLTSITIPNSVTSIGSHALDFCDMTSITIPNSVTIIGNGAFYGCSSLTSVTVQSKTPVTIQSDVFSNRENVTLYVPYGSKATYAAADYWKEFKEIVELVDETDVTAMENVIYAENLQAYVGARKDLSFKMKNTAPIRGFQFDMVLPEGVTPTTYANGTIMCQLSQGRRAEGDQHTISVSRQDDGSYRVLCGSLANDVFTGNDGELITLTVDVAADLSAGNKPIVLKDIKLTETNISNYYETAEVTAALIVDNYKQGDFSGDGKTDVSDYIGVANYILGSRGGNHNAKAADLDGNNIVDISDYIGVANIILTGTANGNPAAARSTRQVETDEKEPQ